MDDTDQFTVFEGSAPEDVSHARQLWSSMSLLPPLESRLESADIRQRLPVSRRQRGGTGAPGAPGARPTLAPSEPQESGPALRQQREERRRYEAMAEQRREILALLRRQREQRIERELLTEHFRPRVKREAVKTVVEEGSSGWESDPELVRQLC